MISRTELGSREVRVGGVVSRHLALPGPVHLGWTDEVHNLYAPLHLQAHILPLPRKEGITLKVSRPFT